MARSKSQARRIAQSGPAGTPAQAGTALQFDLIQNGIDFIRSGIEGYFLRDTPSPRDHKYAVLHIFAGVLLLLKERLRRAHAALIFEPVEEAGKNPATEDIKTVGFDKAIERLKACAQVQIPGKHVQTLRSVQRMRNQLEHYAVSLNLKQTQVIVGRLCDFVYTFMRDELQADLAEHLKGPVWHRVQELRGIAEILEQECAEEWRSRAMKYMNLGPQQLAKLKNSIAPYNPKYNPDPDIQHRCEECAQESVVITEDRDIAVCTNSECGHVFEVGRCQPCGEPEALDNVIETLAHSDLTRSSYDDDPDDVQFLHRMFNRPDRARTKRN